MQIFLLFLRKYLHYCQRCDSSTNEHTSSSLKLPNLGAGEWEESGSPSAT